jgi:AbiV family abortive infection protein
MSHLRSAKKLRRSRELGPAVGLAVLAIEEAVKGFMYRRASRGEIRFVRRGANLTTTFRERDLSEHRVKQGVVIGVILVTIRYLPLLEALEASADVHGPRQARALVLRGLLGQIRWEADLERPGSQAAAQIKRMLRVVSRLDHLKLRGFYVDSRDGHVIDPMTIDKREAADLLELASELVDSFRELGSVATPDLDLGIIREHQAQMARSTRRTQRSGAHTSKKS